MDKNIHIQYDYEKIFLSLKKPPVFSKGYCSFAKSCRPAPSRSTAVLWPWFCSYERWEKAYESRHDEDRNLVLEIVLKGNMRISDGRKEILLEPGMAGIILPGSSRSMPGPAGFCEKVCLVFNGTALDTFLSSMSFSSLEVISPIPEPFLIAVRHLMELHRTAQGNPVDITSESCRLLLELAELRHSSDLPHELSLALHYMRACINTKLTMRTLVYNAHCSRQKLQKLFQIHFGETPFEHFGKMRIETAAEFLRNGKLSVKEIALQCGFRSQLYFSTAFRKHFGESPRTFRKRSGSAGE